METRKTVQKEEFKEKIKIKEEKFEYDIPTMSTNHSNNGSNVRVKEEPAAEEEMPVEEQFIEISTNSVTKMDQSSNEKSKALTKDETRGLLDLILLHPIITSKETKATNNQQKIIEWNQITEAFNATCSVYPRTPKQLRLKWENLKKYARRRGAKIRQNRGKSDVTAEYIPRDEILEKVSTLLRRRSSNSTHSSVPSLNDDDGDSDDSEVDTPVRDSPARRSTVTPFTSVTRESIPDDEDDLPLLPAVETNVSLNTTNGFSGPPRKKKFRSDEGREARNRAIADYYVAKTKLLEAHMNNANLQNEKLKLEVELLKRKAK